MYALRKYLAAVGFPLRCDVLVLLIIIVIVIIIISVFSLST
jgi:hypothetical protein